MNWKELGNITILVADDDAFNRQLIASFFAKHHTIKVIEAGNGVEVIEALSNVSVDMILLDYYMPVLNGEETLKFIRQEPRYEHIPIAMISTDELQHKELHDMGISDFIAKPFDLKKLEAKVYQHILKAQAVTRKVAHTSSHVTSEKLYTLSDIEHSQREMFHGISLIYHKRNGYANKVIAEISKALALKLGYSREVSTNIYYATLIRDIGSMAYPKSLSVELDYSAEEMDRYHKQMLLSFQVVNSVIETNLVKITKRIMSQRKERYDGKGFPRALKGAQISKYASIVAIVEAFDLWCETDKEENATFKRLEAESGHRFQPEMMTTFLLHFPTFVKIRAILNKQYGRQSAALF